MNRSTVDMRSLVTEAITALPAMVDREVTVELLPGTDNGSVPGDATRLKAAVSSLMVALRRELVTSDRLVVRVDAAKFDGAPAVAIALGDEEQLPGIVGADAASLPRFDEWRGGSGLSLAVARRVIGLHGGTLLGPPGVG